MIVSGLPDAVPPLVDLLYAWYTSTSQPHAAPLFLSRAILPYLVLGNLRDASRSYTLFLSKLLSENSASAPQSISSNSDDLKILPSLPGINFLGLLCLAVKRADAGSFRQLRSHYATCIEEAGCWSDPLEELGESCFGIPIPRRGNPLMDIMSNLMGGGGARAALGGGGGSNRGTQNRISYAQTPMDVD